MTVPGVAEVADAPVDRRDGRTRRRLVGGLASGLGAAIGAAACGNVATDTPPPRVRAATVKYLHIDTGQPIWRQTWNKLYGLYAETFPGLKIEADEVPGTIPASAEKAIATFAGGGYYDLLYGHFTVLATYLEANALQPLDPYLAKDREIRLTDFYDSALEKKDGKLFGIAWTSQGKEVWYNADLVKQSGARTPRELEKEGKWTWDALLDISKQVTRTEGASTTVFGFNYPFSATGTVLCSLYAWGADWFDKGFTKATVDSPQFLASTQFAVDMVTKHGVAGGGDFAKGQLAMMITAPGYARTVEEQIRPQQLFNVEVAILPKGPGGRAVPMANATTYLARSSKEPDASWLFIRLLESQEAQSIFLPNGNARYVPSKKVKSGTLFPFEDPAVYEASRAISVPTPLIAKQTLLDTEWATAWNDMVGGKRGVRDALLQVNDRANQLLKQGGCLC